MRIDMLLNKLCLVKTRSIAKNACDKGVIMLGGKPAKASNEVRTGDQIEINMYGYKTVIRIIGIPEGNVAKKDVLAFYEICERVKVG